MIERIFLSFLAAFFLAMIIAVPFIRLMKRIRARQSILCYVEQHKSKEGIPTMGGLIFLIACTVSCLIFWEGEKDLAIVCLVATVVYGAVGALDDGIKIIMKRNLGLRAYQKIISQALIAAILSYYCYKNSYVGAEIYIPIVKTYVSIGWLYIPLCFMIFIATTNCVNLTDGLDGLAGSSVSVYLAAISVLIVLLYKEQSELGVTFYARELGNLLIFTSALVGGVCGFLWHNAHKASIFMGDTGSLALGGACAIIPIMLRNPLVIALVGAVFVLSGFSVIIQVLVYKIKKKRVFLMAPFHHHLEMKGYNESKIVTFYSMITAVAGVVSILIC